MEITHDRYVCLFTFLKFYLNILCNCFIAFSPTLLEILETTGKVKDQDQEEEKVPMRWSSAPLNPGLEGRWGVPARVQEEMDQNRWGSREEEGNYSQGSRKKKKKKKREREERPSFCNSPSLSGVRAGGEESQGAGEASTKVKVTPCAETCRGSTLGPTLPCGNHAVSADTGSWKLPPHHCHCLSWVHVTF